MTTSKYAQRFAAQKAKPQQPRNDSYEPYQKDGSWYFDAPRKGSVGPFVSEQLCKKRADYFRERDDE